MASVMSGVVADLLDDGGYALAASQRVRAGSYRLAEQTRRILLAYRAHRLLLVRGGSGVDDGQPLLIVLLALASHAGVKTFGGYSRGGACAVCGEVIKPNEVEYDIEAGSMKMTIETNCYTLFMRRMDAARHPSEGFETRA